MVKVSGILKKDLLAGVDVDLAANGKLEACKSGELIKEKRVKINFFYSLQIRAN